MTLREPTKKRVMRGNQKHRRVGGQRLRLRVGQPFDRGGVRVYFNVVAEGKLCEAVIERAVEVIGDRAQAMRWLGTPVRALNYSTPISRLDGPQGREDVLRVLMQLEHGLL